jgi:hypothetical protein
MRWQTYTATAADSAEVQRIFRLPRGATLQSEIQVLSLCIGFLQMPDSVTDQAFVVLDGTTHRSNPVVF